MLITCKVILDHNSSTVYASVPPPQNSTNKTKHKNHLWLCGAYALLFASTLFNVLLYDPGCNRHVDLHVASQGYATKVKKKKKKKAIGICYITTCLNAML